MAGGNTLPPRLVEIQNHQGWGQTHCHLFPKEESVEQQERIVENNPASSGSFIFKKKQDKAISSTHMFRTELKTSPAPLTIGHQSNILSLGSCFAEVLGKQLLKNKFQVVANPFGIVYHPIALLNLLDADHLLKDMHFVQREGRWFNYAIHSRIFGNTKEELIHKIKTISSELQHSIRTCDFLVITFGSAYQYVHNHPEFTTGNCHKMPSQLFTKQLTEPGALIKGFEKINSTLRQLNSHFQYILTVSPVRHLKDTLTGNQVSKSILRLVCHQLCSQHAYIHYFPAYEIMVDDLRDYRFYKEDMIHPTAVAEQYIWGKFSEMYFHQSTREIIEKWEGISKGIQHEPFHPSSPDHKKFLLDLIGKTKELSKFIPVEEELKLLQERYTIE